ncbi:MAG: DUF1385 domain-containing protein [Chloroflexota bacterium]
MLSGTAPFFYQHFLIMTDRFHYGGQAVIEGVMMRGQKSIVTVVRRPTGELTMVTEPLGSIYTSKLRKIPLVRGVIALLEVMVLGIRTLLFSANVSLEKEGESIPESSVWILLAVSLAFSTALFFLIPLLFTRLFDAQIHLSSFVFHLIESLFRLGIFVIYLKLMTFMPDIRRLFAYHGAEHKTINAYEDSAPVEVASVKKYSTAHVRCGTSFLFAVMLVAIIVFSLMGRPALWVMILTRICLIPVIAALSYEIIYFGGRHAGNILVRTILYPGLLLQKLTTREPDESQIEVAISALKKAIEVDNTAESIVAEHQAPESGASDFSVSG